MTNKYSFFYFYEVYWEKNSKMRTSVISLLGLAMHVWSSAALFTQKCHIISTAEFHQFSTFVHSHRTKQLRCKATPLRQFLQHSGTATPKEVAGYHRCRIAYGPYVRVNFNKDMAVNLILRVRGREM